MFWYENTLEKYMVNDVIPYAKHIADVVVGTCVHYIVCFHTLFLLFIPLGATTTTLLRVTNATHKVKVLLLQATLSSPRFPLNPCLTLSLAVARGRSPRQVQDI